MLVGKSESRRHVPVECDPVTSNRFVHTEGGICYLLKYIHYLFSCFQLEKCVLMESYEVLKKRVVLCHMHLENPIIYINKSRINDF